MTPMVIECPRCHRDAFGCRIVKGFGTDTHTYIKLFCKTFGCSGRMTFVVDLTPDFVRS